MLIFADGEYMQGLTEKIIAPPINYGSCCAQSLNLIYTQTYEKNTIQKLLTYLILEIQISYKYCIASKVKTSHCSR